MLKYFIFPSQALGGCYFSLKEETAKEINKFAEENNLKIHQIYACDDNGLFVVFEKIES